MFKCKDTQTLSESKQVFCSRHVCCLAPTVHYLQFQSHSRHQNLNVCKIQSVVDFRFFAKLMNKLKNSGPTQKSKILKKCTYAHPIFSCKACRSITKYLNYSLTNQSLIDIGKHPRERRPNAQEGHTHQSAHYQRRAITKQRHKRRILV